jgi:hypothetical protein
MRGRARHPALVGREQGTGVYDRRKALELHSRERLGSLVGGEAAAVITEIQRIFMTDELRTYFATTTRMGPAAHVATKEQCQMMCDAGAFGDDPVSGAADALLFERARVLLLGGGASGERL